MSGGGVIHTPDPVRAVKGNSHVFAALREGISVLPHTVPHTPPN